MCGSGARAAVDVRWCPAVHPSSRAQPSLAAPKTVACPPTFFGAPPKAGGHAGRLEHLNVVGAALRKAHHRCRLGAAAAALGARRHCQRDRKAAQAAAHCKGGAQAIGRRLDVLQHAALGHEQQRVGPIVLLAPLAPAAVAALASGRLARRCRRGGGGGVLGEVLRHWHHLSCLLRHCHAPRRGQSACRLLGGRATSGGGRLLLGWPSAALHPWLHGDGRYELEVTRGAGAKWQERPQCWLMPLPGLGRRRRRPGWRCRSRTSDGASLRASRTSRTSQ